MNLREKEIEESWITKRHWKRREKLISLNYKILRQNAKSLKAEDQQCFLNLRKKELNGVLKKISWLIKSKKYKNKSTDFKESKNSFLKKMKDLRATRIEKVTFMVKVEMQLEQAQFLVEESSTQHFSDNIFLKAMDKKRTQLLLQAKHLHQDSLNSLVMDKEMELQIK